MMTEYSKHILLLLVVANIVALAPTASGTDRGLSKEELRVLREQQRAEDALRDSDGDGFTDLEEKDAGFDPKESREHPSVCLKVELTHIVTNSLTLSFVGVRKRPDGQELMHYRVCTLKQKPRTFFAPIQSMAGGVFLISHTNDVLVVRRGNRDLRLPKGEDLIMHELECSLSHPWAETPLSVRETQPIQVYDTKLTLEQIDPSHYRVRVSDSSTGKKQWIQGTSEQAPAGDVPKAAPEE